MAGEGTDNTEVGAEVHTHVAAQKIAYIVALGLAALFLSRQGVEVALGTLGYLADFQELQIPRQGSLSNYEAFPVQVLEQRLLTVYAMFLYNALYRAKPLCSFFYHGLHKFTPFLRFSQLHRTAYAKPRHFSFLAAGTVPIASWKQALNRADLPFPRTTPPRYAFPAMDPGRLWDTFERMPEHCIPRRYHVASCDSTMSRADAMLEQEQIPPPFALTTDHQREGQGTHGRSWEDRPASSLMATIVIPPSLADALLPLRMGRAVCDLLSGLGVADVALKWPNDCLCGDRKVAGILCRHSQRRAAIGIGINVTAAPAVDFAVSVDEALGGDSGVTPGMLRSSLFDRCAQLLRVPADRVPSMCRSYLWRRGHRVCVTPVAGAGFEATVVDISPDGALIVDRTTDRLAGESRKSVRLLVRAGRISLP